MYVSSHLHASYASRDLEQGGPSLCCGGRVSALYVSMQCLSSTPCPVYVLLMLSEILKL